MWKNILYSVSFFVQTLVILLAGTTIPSTLVISKSKGLEIHFEISVIRDKQEMLQYVTDAPEGPLCATHLLIMLYLSVMFR